ncbi:phage tail tape measure protein [Nocardia sp. NBC_00565]|uniref:phage tail tape measure protein n=1 Tax=Nocardia sp. NBC_00565 TaxID=2975993 RepID=UPI002E82436A|nr:phage tail tape measure protein [Nocardia sp. NBC_00565]WUC03747.1 phage tail tape measure protein [Nocardia sp. NBC_00565]
MSAELAAAHVSLYAETSHLARDAAQAIDRIGRDMEQTLGRAFDRAGDDLRRAMGQATNQAGREMEQSFGQAGRGAGQHGGQEAAGGILDGLKGIKGGVVGEVLGSAFALAGVSAGGLFIKALQQGMEREKVLDLNQARLGVDDATMQKIGFAAGQAFASNFGESVESNIDVARRAINSGLLDRSGTAQETQQIIQQLTSVSDLMGEEIPAVARAAGQAVKTGIAGSATEAFDLFTAAEQNGLNVSEDFLDTITEYGTQFRKLGLSGPEAVGLINQAVLAGARDTDVAADAIKEFSIRVVDGSDSTTEAFQTLGFNSDDLAKKFAQGGSVARGAVGDLLGKIREIKDPLEKNKVALALFGTQFEDLGGALDQFNLDDAAASLGNVAGAAGAAMNTMGDNAAGSIESAQRSIQISTDAISSALAKAFGPELAKVADWVSTHQPEILGFLGSVVDFAFKGADAFLAFSSSSLRALANFAEGAAPLLAMVLDPVGKVAEVFGKLTHNGDLENLGKSVQGLDDKFRGVADGARAIADGIDNTARPALAGLGQSVHDNIESTRLAQEVFRALGQEVTAIPTEHDIILKDNTPEATARLEAMGLKVTTLPNGEVHVTADTADGQAKLDAFIVNNTGRVLPLKGYVSFNQSIPVETLSKVHDIPPGLAGGGVFRGQGGPTDDANLVRISDQEHLAYITRAQAVNPATIPFLDAINAGWVPPPELLHGMVPGFATGGLVPGKAFAQSMDPAVYELGGFSKSSIDCSGLVSAVVNDALGLPAFSERMATASEGGWLAAKGALSGLGGSGDISVGWYNGGPGGGHTAMTLGDGTNVESNGTDGVIIGGPVGANDPMFTNRMHIPAALLRGGDLGGGSATGGGAGGLGGSGALGGGGTGGAAGAGGTSAGGGAIPAGVTPVWIVGGALTGSTGGASSDTTATSSESFAPQASTSGGSNVQTVDQVLASVPGRAAQAGQGFLDANIDQLLGDVGLRRSGGGIQALVSAVWEAATNAAAAEVKKAIGQQNTAIAQFGRR